MRKLLQVISLTIVIIVITVMFLIAGIRVIGITPYSYGNGSTVYVKAVLKTEIENEIEKGDTITYVLNSDNYIATSVVYDIDFEKEYFYVYSSDLTYEGENISDDMCVPVAFADLKGRALFILPFIGYAALFMATQIGFYTVSGITLVCFVVLLITGFLPTKDKRNKKRSAPEPKKDNVPEHLRRK